MWPVKRGGWKSQRTLHTNKNVKNMPPPSKGSAGNVG